MDSRRKMEEVTGRKEMQKRRRKKAGKKYIKF